MDGSPMSDADVNDVDMRAEVERIRNHRFDGYTDTMLADEVESFRNGVGISSIAEAVDALKSVAGQLAGTDATLREELGKLGVEWQSDAGRQAGTSVGEHARFSDEAGRKVSHSAEMIFAQGEAFNRTLHKLPDAQVLRTGAGGLTVGDTLGSLIGFETDHAQAVGQAREAHQQAVDALNKYAADSGENLAAVEAVAPDGGVQHVSNASAPGAGVSPVVGASATSPSDAGVPDTSPSGAPPAGRAPSPVPLPTTSSGASFPTPAAGFAGPGPSDPPGRGTGSGVPAPGGTVPSSTAPSAAPPVSGPTPTPITGPITGPPRPAPGHSSGYGPGPAPGVSGVPGGSTPGGPVVPGNANVSGPVGVVGGGAGTANVPSSGFGGGQQVPAEGDRSRPGPQPGQDPASGRGGAGGATAPAPGAGSAEGPLAKGSSTGSSPQVPGTAGPAPSQAGKVASAGTGLGMGAAAMAAGAAGGATAGLGDQERRGRSQGGNVPKPAPVPRTMSVGAPAEPVRPNKPRSEFLERAAQQDAPDEHDAEHVRRYGIDDADLFNDKRMVAPEVLGDDGEHDGDGAGRG